jgi:hypothetical protein
MTGFNIQTFKKTQYVVGVAGRQSSTSTGYVAIGAMKFNPSDYRPTVPSASQHVKFGALLESAGGLTGAARLYDLSIGTQVINSIIATTTSTPTYVKSPDLNFPSDERNYEIQVLLGSSGSGPTGSDAIVVKLAQLEITHGS